LFPDCISEIFSIDKKNEATWLTMEGNIDPCPPPFPEWGEGEELPSPTCCAEKMEILLGRNSYNTQKQGILTKGEGTVQLTSS
jgi:hypothetical protein